MTRGALFAGAVAALLLAGCTAQDGPTTVTLSAARAEARAILTALEAGAAIYSGAASTTPAQAAAVENAMNMVITAVDAFTANVAAETPAGLGESVSQDLEAALAVLPIDPATKTAIDAGLAIIDGFVAGTFTRPAPAFLALAGAPERVPPAADRPPVPIPPPHWLPPTDSPPGA